MMLFGRQVPPPAKPDVDDWPALGVVESLTAAYLLFNESPAGFTFSNAYGLANLLARGGLPVFWFDRQPQVPVTEARVKAAGAALAALTNDKGEPQGCIVRFVERNMKQHAAAYGIGNDAAAVRKLTEQHVGWLREAGCTPERVAFSMCYFPDQQTPLDYFAKATPAECIMVGCDTYTAKSRMPATPEGLRTVAIAQAAHDLGKLFVTLECGICPVAVGGVPLPEAVQDVDRLAHLWEWGQCVAAQFNSHDWSKDAGAGLAAWGDGVLAHNPAAQQRLRDRLETLGVIEGPLQVGSLAKTLAVMMGHA